MYRFKIITSLVAGFLCWHSVGFPASVSAQSTARVFAQVDAMTAALTEITGWKLRKKVPSELISKAKFKDYIGSNINDKSTQKELHLQETALKMLGLIPQDFDLGKRTEELLGEQAAAFYDYKKKRLYVIDTASNEDEQRMALVHELAHAMADQQHSLGKYLAQAAANPDEATAREAVMEGQATWLTWAYETKLAGRGKEVPAGMIDRLTEAPQDNVEFPVLAGVPLYVRESLLFPYNSGARFQDAVYRRFGQSAFDRVFALGPKNSQQVMHPQIYLDKRDAAPPAKPSYEALLSSQLPNLKQVDGVMESTLGEFEFEILLRPLMGRGPAKALASHWRGGGFRLYQYKPTKTNPDKQPMLAMWSAWDSPHAASEFFAHYQSLMRKKWKMMTSAEAPGSITGKGDSGKFMLRIVDSSVQSIEGQRP